MDWIKNGPDVEKPKMRCVIRLADCILTSGSPFRTGDWDAKRGWMIDAWPASDCFVTHFAIITEPTDAQT